MDPKKLISERSKTHGFAWWAQGMVIEPILPQVVAFMQYRPRYIFAWFLILNKLLRALNAPDYLDHWQDIQGYAQLVINDIENKAKKEAE